MQTTKFSAFIKLLILFISIFVLLGNGVVGAISGNDLQSILDNTAYYDGGTGTTTVCSTTGASFPSGLSFPNLDQTSMATAINTYIKQNYPASLLNGLGQTIVSDGQHSNVNPFFIVADAQHESIMADPTDFNVIHGGNSFGRTAGPGQPSFQGSKNWYYWSSVEASVDYTAPENQGSTSGDYAAFLRAVYGQDIDSNNLTDFINTYAPSSDGNNPTAYISSLQATAQDLIDLTTGASTTNSQSSSSNCSTGSTSCISSQSTISGNAAILCEAEKYEGIYYQSGGGHGYLAFRAACPEGSITAAIASSSAGDPGPCATDCSGLVSVAVDAVFNQSFSWIVSETDGTMTTGVSPSSDWQSIPLSQVQAGDIVTHYDGQDGHVEIVDHINGNTLYTIGSKEDNVQTGTDTSLISGGYWDGGGWRYIGPGASS